MDKRLLLDLSISHEERHSTRRHAQTGLQQTEMRLLSTRKKQIDGLMTYSSFLSGASFLIAVLAYFVSGVLSASSPPEPTTSFGPYKIPSNATCGRITRHTTYISLDLTVGQPSSLVHVLIRLDSVVDFNETSLRLFSSRVAESQTVRCNESLCSDVFLLHTSGPTNGQTKEVVKFEYVSPSVERLSYGIGASIGLGGEFSLKRGFQYWLTATHLCWKAIEKHSFLDYENSAKAFTVNNLILAETEELLKLQSLGSSPAVTAMLDCEFFFYSNISLFPAQASDETRWLGLSSNLAYETAPEGVEDRREVVEVGKTCAEFIPKFDRPLSLYELDCNNAYSTCKDNPSIPFRRAATDQLMLYIPKHNGENIIISTDNDPRLESLPQLEATSDTTRWLSLLKLFLMLLAAAVVWVRAAKTTSSVSFLVMHCIRAAYCGLLPSSQKINVVAVREDAVIGLMAIVGRLGVTVWRMSTTLLSDGQPRVLVVQMIASCVSLFLWILRYFVLERDCETPLTKLGGSTAIVDATTAVMIGFAEPPMFVSSVERFDPTARLLTALLISTVTSHRCLFSTACCGMLASVISSEDTDSKANQAFDKAFMKYVGAAFAGWIVQTVSVAVLMVDLFCVPMAHSMVRGQASTWSELSLALFLGTFSCSLPQLMKTLSLIAEEPINQSEEKKAS